MLAFFLSALIAPALAEPSPEARGAIVGSISLGGELVGALGGGAIGVAVGGSACRADSFECFGPLIGGVFGLGLGGFVGAPVAGGLAGHALHVPGGRVAGWSLAAGGVGVGVLLLGAVTESGGVQALGMTVIGLGMPVTAGIAAGTYHAPEHPGLPLVMASPLMLPGGGGVRVTLAGF